MDTVRTARITGLWYLALGITGMLGFLLIRPRLYVAGDPDATAANLVEHASLADAGLVIEMALVVSQVLAALWFHRLLRDLDRFAAVAVAVFGCFNAVAILVGATFLWTARTVVADPALAPAGDTAATAQLLYELAYNAWGVGALFFGLWLIPMGYVVVTSRRWPVPLGWVLIVGGAGYLVSAFVSASLPDAPDALVDALTFPATFGELWMLGYLVSLGIRPAARTAPGTDAHA
ncbi:DUF4386 domain-containing protein [Cellulomonas sp. S1-8]|uniref:DUF4386 domain-containing protein n=1 Tax=Cellulomonas sp. S1-8 TaxID=2904790 RepID=UPI00224345C4|nr:DUF4386 domain-containing protein [Cellulomonas sp. S1-8]UZN03696.1 DUF4386 domain-containing protein [Cellulomonas sp. S1-8]